MTKETLLKYDWFIDNEYLAQYLSLVSKAEPESKTVQQHHVIPACWYKHRYQISKAAARSVANHDPLQEFVKLSPEQHLEAHRLLTLCTTDEFNEALVFAYEHMKTTYFGKTTNANSLGEISSLDITTTKANEKKVLHLVAKALRVESNYKKPWDQCLTEAKVKLGL